MPHKNRAQALAKLLSGLAVNRVQGLNAPSRHCGILDVVTEKLGERGYGYGYVSRDPKQR